MRTLDESMRDRVLTQVAAAERESGSVSFVSDSHDTGNYWLTFLAVTHTGHNKNQHYSAVEQWFARDLGDARHKIKLERVKRDQWRALICEDDECTRGCRK